MQNQIRRHTFMFELIAVSLLVLILGYIIYKEKKNHKNKMPFSIRKDME